VGAPFALSGLAALAQQGSVPAALRSKANVAIVPCHGYGPQVRPALESCFDLIGGIDKLVRNKTVTVKINLTGTDFSWFLGRPTGETYMTHGATVMALLSSLFNSGASRVRLVESTESMASLPESLDAAGWDIKAINALGKVEYENTRNLGAGKDYARLQVPSGGYMFSAFHLNHSYHDTDVMISLAKLKRHLTAGVTLSMKNMFGITPNSLYSSSAGSERATDGRLPLHSPDGFERIVLPGLKTGVTIHSPFSRVPRIVADICGARPIDLAIIDGISSMTVGEGPWCSQAGPVKLVTPGVLVAGLNPVSTDAVATAVMGFDPQAARGTKPFYHCDNHLLLAEQGGLGTSDLAQIDILGMSLDKARYSYD
jgi:uncharacterized protein (DUF362 family)